MINHLIEIAQNIVQQGLIYSLVVMSVYLTSRVISFDDLTVEGSFGIGGAVVGTSFLFGLSPVWGIPLSIAGGAISGCVTGLLHTKLKINNLISGLVVTTALFSVSLNVAGAQVSLPYSVSGMPLGVLFAVVMTVMLLIALLLKSEIGFLLRALGSNPVMLTNLGKSVDGYKILTLTIANSITALAGALFVLWTGYFSVMGNIGTLVIGLAGLILAEVISRSFGLALIAGAILYQSLFAVVLEMELSPSWNNLIKAALIVVLLAIKR